MTKPIGSLSPRLQWYRRFPLDMMPMLGHLKPLYRGVVEIYADRLWIQNPDEKAEWKTASIANAEDLAYFLKLDVEDVEKWIKDRTLQEALVTMEAFLHDAWQDSCGFVKKSVNHGPKDPDETSTLPVSPVDQNGLTPIQLMDQEDFDLGKWTGSGYIETFHRIRARWGYTRKSQINDLKEWVEQRLGKSPNMPEKQALLKQLMTRIREDNPKADDVSFKEYLDGINDIGEVREEVQVPTGRVKCIDWPIEHVDHDMDTGKAGDDSYAKVRIKVKFDDEDQDLC